MSPYNLPCPSPNPQRPGRIHQMQMAQSLVPAEPRHHDLLPSPHSPAKTRRLSPAMIVAAMGEEALEKLEELEVIFGAVDELGGLDRCTSLRSLTLIDCGLRRISNLEPVSHSLVKMCLCDQGLEKMEGLCLPGLRELYLHQNKIAKMEGLQGCPSLRRLWLFSNRIATMEGLHHCGALRELWLHDNNITTVTGVQSLVHLQNLGLAGNPIGGVRHLSGLRGLPSLVDLALNDVHFGACPVVTAEGYRSFVMCSLRQVRRLDGMEVMEADRADAEQKYEEEALAYQERLEEIERRRVGEIRQAEMARDGSAERGSEVKAEMMKALKGLEGLVQEGRACIAQERSRQEKIQASNILELEANLSELQRQYCREVDKRVQVEEAKAGEEERLFSALEERTCLERDYARLVARQQSRASEGLAVQELSDHSPDFQRVRAEVWSNQNTGSGQVEPMNVLRACRLYNRRLCEDFLAKAGSAGSTVCLYLCVSGNDVEALCRVGLSALGRPAVVLFPDPKQAARAMAEASASVEGGGRENKQRGRTSALREEAAAPRATATTTSPPPPTPTTAEVPAKATLSSASPVSAIPGVGIAAGPENVILQFAVVLREEDVDTVVEDRPNRHSRGAAPRGEGIQRTPPCRAGARVRPVGAQPATGAGSRGSGEEGKERDGGPRGGTSGGVSAALVDRAVASGRAIRLTQPPVRGAGPEVASVTSAVGGCDAGGGVSRGESCLILPTPCFSLALPEFHLLCASGVVGEDKRALDEALAKLCMDGDLGPAPVVDLLAQLEVRMEEQVAAYLERMHEEVTPEEALNLQAADASMRWKVSSLASLRAGVDRERALQEALLSDGPTRP